MFIPRLLYKNETPFSAFFLRYLNILDALMFAYNRIVETQAATSPPTRVGRVLADVLLCDCTDGAGQMRRRTLPCRTDFT
jgi:hypothetical protein